MASVDTAKSKKAKSSPSHPTYMEMVKDAILSLKERTGSSQYAIAKFIEEKQKSLPPNFKKLLSVQIKKLVASGKLVKVKNSYKLPAATKPAAKKPATEKKTTVKPATEKKPKKAVDSKPKAKKVGTPVKGKAVSKPKAANMKSPRKVAAAKTAVQKAKAAKVKKTPVKAATKKPKSIKSPAKKPAAKKAKK
ncbi:Linker histone H1/H5, domain H15 [Dillenia turbinata]|uniref:Linker histone H1/H5, domain H15 n=1 Tax=Dillenia turbinata TaxID=194707 RepID=A0AAN8V965_9MAGN